MCLNKKRTVKRLNTEKKCTITFLKHLKCFRGELEFEQQKNACHTEAIF
jgi:hypothetical protein